MTACVKCERPTGRRFARYCDACRWRLRGRTPKWVWTPERDELLRRRYDPYVRGRAREIAAALGMPRNIVNHRAGFLGLAALAKDRKAWTDGEDAFLDEHAGTRHVRWLGRQLKRSTSSVINRMKRLRISRRWREGYTLRDLELCLGTDHRVIERWVGGGKLRGRRRFGNGGPTDAWYFTDEDLLRFITEHPTEFSLRHVDQVWFLDLVRTRPPGRPRASGKSTTQRKGDACQTDS